MDEISDMNNQELEQALEEARSHEEFLMGGRDSLFAQGMSVDDEVYMGVEMELVEAERRVANILQEMKRRAADLAAAEDEGTFRQGFLNQLRGMRP